MDGNMELQHWGIKGQKWGIRRYQNPDGTLTAAGKKRYYYQNPDGSLTEEGKKNYMTGSRKGMINPKKLSDADLNMINKRFAAENNFNQNVQKYKESTFSYKAKQAVLNRLKGNGGGGGGGGGKGGGKGGKGIASILTMPIKKALEDAFKFNPNTGNNKGDDDREKDADDFYKAYTKNGNRFVGSKTADKVAQILTNSDGVERGRKYVETARRTISVDVNSGGRMGTYDATKTGTDFLNRRVEQHREAERQKRERERERERERNNRTAEQKRQAKEQVARKRERELEERAAKSGIYLGHNDMTQYIITRMSEDELMHHGIKGQKWGVRRFENSDGTLTAEGKERYGSGGRGIKSGRTKDLVGSSTNSEADYARSCGSLANDPKIRRQLSSIISSSKDPKVSEAVGYAGEWKNATNKLANAYKTFSERLKKDRGGKEWDGDGTEQHWEMKKRYPEYNDISRNEQRALKKLVESSVSLAKSKEFSGVKGFEKSKNYFDSFPEYGNWFKKGDQRAYPIAMTLLAGNDTNKYYEVFPSYFVESFDSSGNKIDTGMFDTD